MKSLHYSGTSYSLAIFEIRVIRADAVTVSLHLPSVIPITRFMDY